MEINLLQFNTTDGLVVTIFSHKKLQFLTKTFVQKTVLQMHYFGSKKML